MFKRDPSSESPTRRRRFRVLPLILFAVFGALYYFGNQQTVPITGRSQFVDMGRAEETALGLQSYQAVLAQEQPLPSGAELELVRSVGKRIAAATEGVDFKWEFNLLNSPQINAFCLPGGKVAVYSGILPVAESATGLAVVMGHEIAHALARHGAERMSQGKLLEFGKLALGMSMSEMDPSQQRALMGAFGIGAQFGVLLPFSRGHESEADKIGLTLMARACFDPREAPKFWERMASAKESGGAPPEFMSTHPSDSTRIQQLHEWMPEAVNEFERVCGGEGR